ncbi:MAG TPA: DUF4377 domain-containing protein [Ignavibacteria bacterium]|nr:DUF4377 domain-containing protein [Ignavibacteria bacterium]
MKILLVLSFVIFTSVNLLSKDLPIRFYVGNHKVSCTGVTSQMCLLMKNSPDGVWQYYHNEIEGFKYEEGYDYEILVNKKVIDNPPADGPSFVYKLVNIVKKIPTMVISQSYRQKLNMKEYYLTRIRVNDKTEKFADNEKVNIKFILNDNTVTGMDGCNSFSGRVIINKDSISFLNFASSRMFCQEVKVDKIFYQLIGMVSRYKISGNFLKLYNGKKLLLEYSQN